MILILVCLAVGHLIQQPLCLASLLLFFQSKCVCAADLLLVLLNLKIAETIVLTFLEENQPPPPRSPHTHQKQIFLEMPPLVSIFKLLGPVWSTLELLQEYTKAALRKDHRPITWVPFSGWLMHSPTIVLVIECIVVKFKKIKWQAWASYPIQYYFRRTGMLYICAISSSDIIMWHGRRCHIPNSIGWLTSVKACQIYITLVVT